MALNICKCGHFESKHNLYRKECMQVSSDNTGTRICDCKQYSEKW